MEKKIVSVLLCLLCLSGWLCPAVQAEWEYPERNALAGESVLLVRLDSGEVIFEQDSDIIRRPASMTKLMTALVALEHGADPEDVFTVPQSMAGELRTIQENYGVRAGFGIGQSVTVRTLLYLTLLPSCNDTASMLAVHTAGDMNTFVGWMNDRAAELGCTDTHFTCPHGLYEFSEADGNWTTAQDMAKIGAACLANELLREIVSAPFYWLPPTAGAPNLPSDTKPEDAPAGYRRFVSTNPLQNSETELFRAYDHGLKTGFTDLAGHCFTTSFDTDSGSYLLVLMGAPHVPDGTGFFTVFSQAAAVGDWVNEQFRWEQPLTPGKLLQTVAVTGSPDGETVDICTADTADEVQFLMGPGDTVTTETVLPEVLPAPLEAGQVVGSITVLRSGELMGTVELVTERAMTYSKWTDWQQQFWATDFGRWLMRMRHRL